MQQSQFLPFVKAFAAQFDTVMVIVITIQKHGNSEYENFLQTNNYHFVIL